MACHLPLSAAARWIGATSDELVELARQLLRFDTTTVEPAIQAAHNDESDCQEFLQNRLRKIGAQVESVTPDPGAFRDHPMMPAGHHWRGRPMTLARWPGTGGGRHLILNGHIDVVSAEPVTAWSAPPFAGQIVGDRLVGRGAADMKGGIAAMVFALEALHATGRRPAGDVWVQLVTDEETNGMGTVAMLSLQPPAHGAIVPEPSHFDAWVACRGALYGTVTIHGRPGHAELPQPDAAHGGAVGAIAKLEPILAAIRTLNNDWEADPRWQHELLNPPVVVPTMVEGGEFVASFPHRCTLSFDATYLPAGADDRGTGTAIRQEISERVQRALSSDAWLTECPPTWSWTSDYPPHEARDVAELAATLEEAGRPLGIEVRPAGLNAWHDAATLGLGGIPALSCGPGEPAQAHAIDESIAIRDLVTGAQLLADAIDRFCASAPRTR